jgi:periplasmic divalent cation tolerance protein
MVKNQVVLYTTFASIAEAETIANFLVDNHLAACVNILGDCLSIYFWNGQKHKETEIAAVIKTQDEDLCRAAIIDKHSYSEPLIIRLS